MWKAEVKIVVQGNYILLFVHVVSVSYISVLYMQLVELVFRSYTSTFCNLYLLFMPVAYENIWELHMVFVESIFKVCTNV